MGDESPKNKVKFLCSYGGKVLPRPSDGLLRYVGGETRVVSLPRDITFSDNNDDDANAELMKKVSSMVEGEMVLKYQLVPEDLDALVSVRTEEDVKHMIEEHDRPHTGMLRAFLFSPSKPGLVASEPYLLEQRYIDAVNGIIRTSPKAARGSACSSPKSSSPDHSPRFANSHANANTNANATANIIQHANVRAMQRVQSSPSLTNLNGMDHLHHLHYPHVYPSSSSPSRPPQDPQLGRMGPTGRGAYYYTNTNTNAATATRQPQRGPYAYHDDSAAYGHVPIERILRSPRRMSIWE
ncbi:hypothetical protein CR513_19600, partial [Mucuna pruriens]